MSRCIPAVNCPTQATPTSLEDHLKHTWRAGDSTTSEVCSLWHQARVCLGRKWIFEKQDGVLPALYWRLGSTWSLRCASTLCPSSLLASLLFALALWSLHIQLIRSYLLCGLWPGPSTPSLEESCGASVEIDLKLRPEPVLSEHALRLRLISDTVCNVKLGLNSQIAW